MLTPINRNCVCSDRIYNIPDLTTISHNIILRAMNGAFFNLPDSFIHEHTFFVSPLVYTCRIFKLRIGLFMFTPFSTKEASIRLQQSFPPPSKNTLSGPVRNSHFSLVLHYLVHFLCMPPHKFMLAVEQFQVAQQSSSSQNLGRCCSSMLVNIGHHLSSMCPH